MTEYNNGAITASSYMAEQGVNKSDVQLVADAMNISLDNIDCSDKKRFMDAYGDFPIVQYTCVSCLSQSDVSIESHNDKDIYIECGCGERCEPSTSIEIQEKLTS
jgi:hypothetical protein